MKVEATGKIHGFKKRISKKDGFLREIMTEQWAAINEDKSKLLRKEESGDENENN